MKPGFGRTAAHEERAHHTRWATAQMPVTFVAFDVLHLDSENLYARPLVEPKILRQAPCSTNPIEALNVRYRRGTSPTPAIRLRSALCNTPSCAALLIRLSTQPPGTWLRSPFAPSVRRSSYETTAA